MVTGEDRATDPDDARATAFSVYLSAAKPVLSETISGPDNRTIRGQNYHISALNLYQQTSLMPFEQVRIPLHHLYPFIQVECRIIG